MIRVLFTLLIFFPFSAINAFSEELLSISDLSYQGAARIDISTFGESRMAYTEGTFAVSPNLASIFVVGHTQHQAIAEFSLPQLSMAQEIPNLPMAKNKQPFYTVFDRVPTGNPDGINRITGLELVSGNLIANGVQYYDGDANNTDTTFVIEDPMDLKNSPITGFLKLAARAHATGWITPIPPRYQDSFKGDYIFGYASNYAINSRSSMGPSAFSVNISNVLNANSGSKILMETLLDYSIENPLAQDAYNHSGENDLWTEVSKAFIGFIVPGSDTYAVFGSTGGLTSGIGYKITQDNGFQCGGPCPYKASDIYNYYWFYKVNDLLSVSRGEKLPYELTPYDYGEFKLPFQNQDTIPKLIIGASFDEASNTLFFMLGGADKLQSQYEKAPLILSYRIDLTSRPLPPSSISIE